MRIRFFCTVLVLVAFMVDLLPTHTLDAATTPGTLSFTTEATTINLAWTPVGRSEGYRIYRDGTQIADLSETTLTYRDLNLVPGRTYDYQIKYWKNDTQTAVLAEGSVSLGGTIPVDTHRVSESGTGVPDDSLKSNISADANQAALLAQIESLTKLIAELQAQLAAQRGGASTLTSERVALTDNVNVRSSPGIGSAPVTVMTLGSSATKISTTPVLSGGYRWINVRFNNGVTGWIADVFTRAVANAQTVAPQGTAAASDRLTLTDNVNVRSGAGTTNAPITIMPLGSGATRLSTNPVTSGGYRWINVRFDNGVTGWIADAFTRIASSGVSAGQTNQTNAVNSTSPSRTRNTDSDAGSTGSSDSSTVVSSTEATGRGSGGSTPKADAGQADVVVNPETTVTTPTAPRITYQSVNTISAESARIQWILSQPATGFVEYGKTTGYGMTTTKENRFLSSHTQLIQNLEPNTTYHYRVHSENSTGGRVVSLDRTFTTAALPPTQLAQEQGTESVPSPESLVTSVFEAGDRVSFTDNVNARTSAGTSAGVVTVASEASQGTVLGDRPIALDGYTWIKVSLDTGLSGWVADAFLREVVTSSVVTVFPSVNSRTETSVRIGWSVPGGGTGYIEYDTTPSYGNETTRETRYLSTHNQTISNLDPGTTYHYRVRGMKADGSEVRSVGSSFTTLGTSPQDTEGTASIETETEGAPDAQITSQSVNSITDTSARVRWDLSDGATGYIEYGTTDTYGSETTRENRYLTTHIQTISNLNPGTTYHYRINGVTSSGEIIRSADRTFTTTGAPAEDASGEDTPPGTVYEDAEDGNTNGWSNYTGTPGTVQSVYDSALGSRVIEFTGSGTQTGYRLRNANGTKWQNTTERVLSWNMKYNETFQIFIDVETTAGHRYLYYTNANSDALGTGEYVRFGLGAVASGGSWQFIERDLQADLNKAQSGVRITEVNGFLIRGGGRVDNITLSAGGVSPVTVPSDTNDGEGSNSDTSSDSDVSTVAPVSVPTPSVSTTNGERGGASGRSVAGNGVREPTEQCDDGNTRNGDGCSSTGTLEGPVNSSAYFVTTSGNNGNSGRTEAEAFQTISYGVSKLQPGDTLYVKAGNYGAATFGISKSGTASKPITIEGYRNAPGDNPRMVNFDHTSSHDASVMPLIDGGSGVVESTGIVISGNHVIVKNFQVTRYRFGAGVSGQNSVLDNIIATKMAIKSDAPYKGGAFYLYGSNNTLRNSVGVDAGAQAITLFGSNHVAEFNKYYGTVNADENGTDYYFIVNGDPSRNVYANDNVIRNNYIERVGNQVHGGHGFTVKKQGEGNLFEHNTAVNIRGGSFVARHKAVKNNTFRNNTAERGLGLAVRDGASGNVFSDNVTDGSSYGIWLFDAFEDPYNDGTSGEANRFENITIRGATAAINYGNYTNTSAIARNNVFDNLTIDGATHLFWVEHYAQNEVIKNSTIKNVSNYARARSPRVLSDLDVTFQNSTCSNCGFTLP